MHTNHEINPEEVVQYLDRYIIGQKDAKKAVAIAMRNRWRRKQLSKEWRQEITPANILMKGSTGTGKTEIARRLAALAKAPFLKVEATKYTEVGIVGQDTHNMVKDLMNIAVAKEFEYERKKHWEVAKRMAEQEILTKLKLPESNENFEKLRSGVFDNEIVSITLDKPQPTDFLSNIHNGPPTQEQLLSILKNLKEAREPTKKSASVKVSEGLDILTRRFANERITKEQAIQRAKEKTEQEGIIFIDEIDKLAADSSNQNKRNSIKGLGVQRELLSLIEGCTVQTDYGPINTDHILFIGSGAFHHCHPSDLLPELQGRLPVRVELLPLTKSDFIRIVSEKEFNLIEQTKRMLAAEGLELEFEQEAIERIAEIALALNSSTEDIGARRLITVLQQVVNEISFYSHQLSGTKQLITAEYVNNKIGKLDKLKTTNLSKYII